VNLLPFIIRRIRDIKVLALIVKDFAINAILI